MQEGLIHGCSTLVTISWENSIGATKTAGGCITQVAFFGKTPLQPHASISFILDFEKVMEQKKNKRIYLIIDKYFKKV